MQHVSLRRWILNKQPRSRKFSPPGKRRQDTYTYTKLHIPWTGKEHWEALQVISENISHELVEVKS